MGEVEEKGKKEENEEGEKEGLLEQHCGLLGDWEGYGTKARCTGEGIERGLKKEEGAEKRCGNDWELVDVRTKGAIRPWGVFIHDVRHRVEGSDQFLFKDHIFLIPFRVAYSKNVQKNLRKIEYHTLPLLLHNRHHKLEKYLYIQYTQILRLF